MMNRLRGRMLILPLLVAFFANSTSAVDLNPFGALLDGLAARVDKLIQVAEQAGNVLIVGAAGQVASTIGYAKAAYEEELQSTLDKLGPAENNLFNSLSAQVNSLEKGVVQDAKEILDHGTVLANVLPIGFRAPQVSGFHPSYFVQTTSNATSPTPPLEIDGNFVDASRPGFTPTLKISGQPASLVGNGTVHLTFSLPAAALRGSATGLTLLTAELSVPHDESFLGVFHRKSPDSVFKFPIYVLPPSVGQIVVHAERQVPGPPARVLKMVGPFTQSSDDNDIPEPPHKAEGKLYCVHPEPGFTVETSSVGHFVTQHQGDEGNVLGDEKDWYFVPSGDSNALNACQRLTTIVHHIGTSGKVVFYITFFETQPRTQTSAIDINDKLDWGTSKRVDLPSGSNPKATFMQFDRRSFDINFANFSNPYLSVSQSPDGTSLFFLSLP